MRRLQPEIRLRSRQLRQPQTPAEKKLWFWLQDSRLDGYKFRRQHPIGFYIVDFYCAQKNLVIEIDGDSHGAQLEHDRERTIWLQAQGCNVICFTREPPHPNLPPERGGLSPSPFQGELR